MPAPDTIPKSRRMRQIAFAPHELEQIQPVIDAVCSELGVAANEMARRRAVAQRVMAAYRVGRPLPLNMVDAGLPEPLRRQPV